MAEFAMILDKNIKYEALKGLPCVKGKQSAVAVVNNSPVDCQSRDLAARRRLSREQNDRGIVAAHWAAHAGRDSMCIFAPVEQK